MISKMGWVYKIWVFIFFFSLLIGCTDSGVKKKKTSNATTLFSLVENAHTGINFINTVKQDINFNYIEYLYAFNGAGVAIGDINNDGLEDIYFTSNQNSNKLYLNQGDFKFVDATTKAGLEDTEGWSTGVSMVDINNDGWLDIYVSKSASFNDDELRKNKLFINQKDGTFKNEAKKWGLDQNGFSIQSYFFDYDKDGDLDMYLVNHRPDFSQSNKIEYKAEREYFRETSDHLFRNDGNTFTDVTLQAKIMNKEWGLSASIGDFNNDGWLDVYVANDFINPDYLYINNKDGTFSNQINMRFKHIPYNGMGSDYADINNDFLPDLVVLDMLAEDHRRGKENMASMNTQGFWKMVESGYHYSYMANTLQLNNGNGSFSDIGQLAGISKTDWSWAPLIADFDNDGHKDIFVSNGIERELGNQDYKKESARQQKEKGAMTVQEMMNIMPSEKIANYIYKNNGDFTFEKMTEAWGLSKKVNSNGVAYADLDNDGDLDLVMNNMSDEATVYRNNSTNNYINIKLIGDEKNVKAIGAKVKVYSKEKSQYQELFPSRGYQSSMGYQLNFGLGNEEIIDRIEVTWGDNSILAMDNVEVNQTLVFDKKDFKFDGVTPFEVSQNFVRNDASRLGITYHHQENNFNDFDLQTLLPQKQSQRGPALSVADVNGDGLDDFYVGGALNQAGEMYLQTQDGKFNKASESLFSRESKYEDITSLFFDADADGDLDLYVGSGSYEVGENNPLLQDRLYLNDGKGDFSKSNKLPKMFGVTKAVAAHDVDGDGDLDLVVGGQVIPGKYPLSSKTYLLTNENGRYIDSTEEIAPELMDIGIVNDLLFTDYDGDGDKDLAVVGEWFPITFFNNQNGKFTKTSIAALNHTEGWWNTITEVDLDKDGNMDYLVGNLGDNNKFHPTKEKPLHVYSTNFDEDGKYDMILSKVYQGNLVPVRGKECSTEQNPFVSEKIQTYKEFANSTLIDIYGEEELNSAYHKQVHEFGSVYLKNKGDGSFEVQKLPTTAQFGPTMAFQVMDINQDGHLDILGVGNIYEAEVETIRYDANTGYILLGDSKGNLTPHTDISFFTQGNVKDMKKIAIGGEACYLIANNDEELTIFKVKKG
ncbi:VCBS repeat-containing protein [Muricauda sp. CAU 1633]|uniref:VCBS repeat-containing protein n=1 Tax=Allomuricauda sp. CAU 1633 TaxID=2816036 RepID=UPI001A8C58F9|nr:FG-GAP-like repeat-containing protein [Muricauda sp. CAU 1633]MBO0320707.1 VCBS repeat-containing protein [Muricauda sp. CAU 1633]